MFAYIKKKEKMHGSFHLYIVFNVEFFSKPIPVYDPENLNKQNKNVSNTH